MSTTPLRAIGNVDLTLQPSTPQCNNAASLSTGGPAQGQASGAGHVQKPLRAWVCEQILNRLRQGWSAPETQYAHSRSLLSAKQQQGH
jgi:hypothetical protein